MSTLLPELTRICEEAGRVAITERRSLVRELKPDGSIVTNADKAVEKFLRPALTQLVPGTTVWGEEFGWEEPGENGLWVVDPVDGTSNFAYLQPLWGISIGLVKGPEILMGAIALPDFDEIAVGVKGERPTLNGEPMAYISPGPIQKHELVRLCDGLSKRLSNPPGNSRCSGAFVIDGLYTATQRYRGLFGHREHLYDVASTILFVEELGGEVRYADGTPLDIEALSKPEKIAKPWIAFPAGTGYVDNG